MEKGQLPSSSSLKGLEDQSDPVKPVIDAQRMISKSTSSFRGLLRSDFVRSASALVGGTAIAQGLAVVTLPVLAHMYSPADFATLATYAAVFSMIQVIICLGLEIAVPLPSNDCEAANLAASALTAVVVVTGIVTLLVWLIGEWFFSLINQHSLYGAGWLLPISLAFAGLFAVSQSWALRKRRFKSISMARVAQSGGGAAVQIALGGCNLGVMGLLCGHALAAGAGAFGLVRAPLCSDTAALRAVSVSGMSHALTKYRRITLLSTWEALAANGALQLPILLIAAHAAGPEVGFLMLAVRAIGTPVNLVGAAVSNVYLARARDKVADGTIPQFTSRLLLNLSRFGVAPLLVFGAAAPWCFSMVFGEEWRRAGELVTWMTPWFLFKLLSTSISMVMQVQMKQLASLVLVIAGLVGRLLAVLAAFTLTSAYVVEVYAIANGAFYLVSLGVYMHYSGIHKDKTKDIVKSFAKMSVLGLVLAAIARALLV